LIIIFGIITTIFLGIKEALCFTEVVWDIVEAVYYFATDAAKYLTSVILPVDGGNSIGF